MEGAKVVAGYQNVMPDFSGAFDGNEYKRKKLTAIIEYIKSVGDTADYKPMAAPAASCSGVAAAANGLWVKLILPWSSISETCTFKVSPIFTTTSTLLTR